VSLARRERNLERNYSPITRRRGKNKIIAVGDHRKCPQCDRMGRVVWISEDKKTAGVQCPAPHHQITRPKSRFGPTTINPSKTSKNTVFFIDVPSLPNV
jgi:hypothetical protein